MSSNPVYTETRVRGWIMLQTNGVPTHRRREDDTDWTPLDEPLGPEPERPELHLFVVRQNQGEGKGHHWSIYITDYNNPCVPGLVYQVKGDHTFMHHQHATGRDLFTSNSYQDALDLGAISDAWVAHIGNNIVPNTPPPQAETQAQVVDTCQTWVIKVIRALVEQGLLSEDKLRSVEAMRNERLLS